MTPPSPLPCLRLLALSLFHLSAFSLCPAFAGPVARQEPCPACKGRKSLSLTPPNLGQYDGEIGVTPGRPFTSHRWDVRHDRCPLCGGTGRHELWELRGRPPADAGGLEPCTACWWSGAAPCKKCQKTGFAPCPACVRGRHPGWVLTEQKTPGRTSRHVKRLVMPCPACQGLGRTVCPDCDGRGGTPCRACKGAGARPAKERR